MAEEFKLDSDDKCNVCNVVTMMAENLLCTMCKAVFHGTCANTSEDEKMGTKSLITAFNRPSTKENFKFSVTPAPQTLK